MINEVIRYSAVTAKARAMYGKCLSHEDWVQLKEFTSISDVWGFLAQKDAWSAVGDIPAAALDENALIKGLTEQLKLDCDKLCLYLGKKDADTLRFFLRSPLEGHMSQEEQRVWWSKGGAKNAGLRRVAGAEADALNIVYILRLRRFPKSKDRVKDLLIPIQYKLKPELVRRLLYAEDDTSVKKILNGTIWRDVFKSFEPGELEKQFDAYMEAFCQRVLAASRPGLVTAQAFMMLKNMERIRLTRAIGAIARGISPNTVV